MTDGQNRNPIPPTGYTQPQNAQRVPASNSDVHHAAPQHTAPQPQPVKNPQHSGPQAKAVRNPQHSGPQAKVVQETNAPKQKKGGSSFVKALAGGFVGAALACVLAFGIFGGFGGGSTSGSTVIGGSGSSINISEDADRAEAVAQKCLPSIAAIDVYANQSSSMGMFSQSSDSVVQTGLGSGVVISEDGYILTNNHVVTGASGLKVTVGGEQYDGKVVGTDELTDLAVVKIDANGLTAIEIGDSDNIAVGQWVMALGSPFGLEQSVSTGIVSATSRTITVNDSEASPYGGQSNTSVYTEMIQTDAAINPGNSGGALVDAQGRLIGINSVIESASGSSAGVGFAIPSNYAISIATQIIDGKAPTHAALGVACVTIDSSTAERYKMPVSSGAYISSVNPGSAAEKAGLQEGDIITAVDSTPVESSTDLIAAIRTHSIGDKVQVTYVKDGQTKTAEVTLGSDGIE